MKWVTRERPKIDRIACPWLITRFIDKDAEFLYVPADQVLAVAETSGATPYDIPDVEYSHVGALCSFDAFISKRMTRCMRGAGIRNRKRIAGIIQCKQNDSNR